MPNADDFAELSSEPTAAKHYDNSEFEVWRVYGAKE